MPRRMSAATAIAELPLRTADEVFAHCHRAVVMAPHPDDESLGCGGAIALMRQRSIPVHIVVVSDGTGSHSHSRQYPPLQLRMLREHETRVAASHLGVATTDLTFWRWPDKQVPQVGSAEFSAAVQQCDRLLRRCCPSLVLVPWWQDQHCDHRATAQIVQSCLQTWPDPPQRWAYSIWGSKAAGLATLPAGETGWRLDISAVQSVKRAAVMAHQSQTTDLIRDDPSGFRLTADMLENLIQPWETYLRI